MSPPLLDPKKGILAPGTTVYGPHLGYPGYGHPSVTPPAPPGLTPILVVAFSMPSPFYIQLRA